MLLALISVRLCENCMMCPTLSLSREKRSHSRPWEYSNCVEFLYTVWLKTILCKPQWAAIVLSHVRLHSAGHSTVYLVGVFVFVSRTKSIQSNTVIDNSGPSSIYPIMTMDYSCPGWLMGVFFFQHLPVPFTFASF